MKRVTIRVPATTANLGPGFDAFGCALGLYTDVTFEETECGLEITGCPEEFTGPDNLVYTSYCAVLNTMSEEVRGVKIHIDAHIPICRGLGSSAALLVAGAMGANVLRGNKLSTQGLLNITNAMEGHPDNLAPAFYGGLTASMVDGGLPVSVSFPLHPDWEFVALIPEFDLPTVLARSVLPEQVSRADAIYNISHGALVLKALELGDEKLLRTAMQDKLHQNYRKKLIPDYEKIEALVRTTGAAFCLSGAGPTLLCITRGQKLEEVLTSKLDSITEHSWQMLPLHVEFQGAHIIAIEEYAEVVHMIIKPYEESYRDDLIFMVLQAKDVLGRKPRINEDLLDIKTHYFDRGDMFWIAIDDADRVIGCIGYNREPDSSEAFLHRLYVKATKKRTGIGSKLLEIAEAEMRNRGITASHVHLGSPKEQWFESYAFYPKHGYQEYKPRYMRKFL